MRTQVTGERPKLDGEQPNVRINLLIGGHKSNNSSAIEMVLYEPLQVCEEFNTRRLMILSMNRKIETICR